MHSDNYPTIHRPSKHQDFYQGLEVDPETFLQNETLVASALDEVDWTQEAIQDLQYAINYENMATTCLSDIQVSIHEERLSMHVC